MNKLPIISIVGRQNVGKSTLFNVMTKDKIAIVDAYPGLTRDILSYNLEYKSIAFTLTDTPGLDLDNINQLTASIKDNAIAHLSHASAIILLLESPAPTSFDLDLAEMLRKLSIPTIIAVNKMDDDSHLEHMSNFYEMGFNDILPISALRKKNIPLLFDKIINLLPVKKTKIHEADLKISLVGRPNSGKSTLLNAFLGYERSVVSNIPGTTRDSVDDDFLYHKKNVKIIDTAGIRRKSKITDNIEFYSLTRTLESLKRCDVAIHLIDAELGLTETDKKISDEIVKTRKPIIIAVNKWDAIEKNHKTFEEFKDKVIFKFYKAEDYPIISISAKNKQRINKLVETAFQIKEKANRRIETPKLNQLIDRLQHHNRLPQLGGKIRIYYATQIDSIPPQFKLFVNNVEFFRKDTIRYFEKELKKELDLLGIPIILHIEGKKQIKAKKQETTGSSSKQPKKTSSPKKKKSSKKTNRAKKK